MADWLFVFAKWWDWLARMLVSGLLVCLAEWLGCLANCLVGYLAEWLGCLAGLLFSKLVGWLSGWLVSA